MALAILASGFLLPASGSQIILNPPRETSTFAVDVSLVNILCTVRDKNGAYVKDLSKEDFEVREDGEVQEITHFARGVDTPLTVALLLDVSGSVANIIGIEKQAGARFFADVLRPTDKALLVSFAQLIAVLQDLTPSVDRLQAALDQAGPFLIHSSRMQEVQPRGGTLLYDAVNLVAAQKLKRLPGRKTMVLITDGQDNGSMVRLDVASRAAQEADAVVYGIHYQDEARSNPRINGAQELAKLSEPTGGRMFHVSDKLPLEKVFAEIQEEMRNQYGLGYKPPDPATDGAYHHLEVRCTRPGVKVQARTGYYAVKR
jgi:Ca-activated chloride channel family protein